MSSVFPSTISCYSRGSFLRRVRCKPCLMFELEKLKGLFMATRPMGSETGLQSQVRPLLWRLWGVCGGERIRQLASHTCAVECLPLLTFLFAPLRKHFKADTRHHVIKCTDLCSGLMFPSVAKLESEAWCAEEIGRRHIFASRGLIID